jgi:hypothetical protein
MKILKNINLKNFRFFKNNFFKKNRSFKNYLQFTSLMSSAPLSCGFEPFNNLTLLFYLKSSRPFDI